MINLTRTLSRKNKKSSFDKRITAANSSPHTISGQNKRQRAYRYGLSAEKLASWYLRFKGYRIVAERYRNGGGEIDIVAQKGKTLIAVEVKARRTLAECYESIAPWKQQKIARAAAGLLAGQGLKPGLAKLHQHDIRFDVIWVAPKRWPVHIRDAWRIE